nr:hypothetical protein [uncultured Rhodopila sp.]
MRPIYAVLILATAAAVAGWLVWIVGADIKEQNAREAAHTAARNAEIAKFRGAGASNEIRERLVARLSVKGPFLLVREPAEPQTVSVMKRPVDWVVKCDLVGLSVVLWRAQHELDTEVELLRDATFLTPQDCERLSLITSVWLERLMTRGPRGAAPMAAVSFDDMMPDDKAANPPGAPDDRSVSKGAPERPLSWDDVSTPVPQPDKPFDWDSLGTPVK